jgi:hypothetical protein
MQHSAIQSLQQRHPVLLCGVVHRVVSMFTDSLSDIFKINCGSFDCAGPHGSASLRMTVGVGLA